MSTIEIPKEPSYTELEVVDQMGVMNESIGSEAEGASADCRHVPSGDSGWPEKLSEAAFIDYTSDEDLPY